MLNARRIALPLALLVVVLSPPRADAEDVEWQNATAFEVEGRGWAETAGPFDRLPESAKPKVSEAVWNLSHHSSGICIRFATDSATVSVRWSLTSDSLDMPHMPATGVSGVDLYARSADGSWRFIGNGRPHQMDGNLATFAFPGGARPDQECLLYLPTYNGTKSLEIGVPPGGHLEKPRPRPEASRKPIVVYGTSIVQGGCASRPGMIWTAILGRLLDRPVINLGFSGSGTMAPPVAEPLAELDPAAYVIDCTWNMSVGPEVYLERISALVRTLRQSHPSTPILFIGQSSIRPDSHPTDLTRHQEAAVLSLQHEGIKGLLLVPGDSLIGADGEATVDGVHLNDLGMDRQARALLPVVQKALKDPM